MRQLLLVILFSFSFAALADGSTSWFNAEYTYTDFTYKESALTEAGRLGGLRGELGFLVGGQFGVSVGGEYQDGGLDFNGTTLAGVSTTGLTKDYIRDTRLMVHYFMGNMLFAAGTAQREWYDNLYGHYHRREIFSYYPVTFTYNSDNLYFKVETDFAFRGHVNATMSEVGAGERDLEFSRSSGTGFAAEVGYAVGTGSRFASRMFLSYRRLNLGDAGTQNDGVRNVTVAAGTLNLVQAGIGVGF